MGSRHGYYRAGMQIGYRQLNLRSKRMSPPSGQISPLSQRPLMLAVFGAVFAVASVTGPLLGGAFAGMSYLQL